MTITEPRTDTDTNPLMTRTDRRTVGKAAAKEAGARAKAAEVEADKKEKLAGLDVEGKSLDIEEKRQRVERRQRQADREEQTRVRAETVKKWKARGKALVHALPVIVAVSAVAALILASVWIAWPAQAEAMREDLGARSWVVPGVVEGLTWTSASLTILAVRRKAPAGRYRAMTVISALIAASLNLFHSPSASAGQINALASLAGVLAFELVVGLLQHTQSGRTAADVREQLARWIAHPLVSLTAWRIRAANRTGIKAQEAWNQAWESHHGVKPGMTAARVRRQRRAEARMERARSEAGRRRVRELKRSLEATTAEAAIAESSAEAAQARAEEMKARAEEFRYRAIKEEQKALARLSSQKYRKLPWVGGEWVPVLPPQASSGDAGQPSGDAKFPFPSGESVTSAPDGKSSEDAGRKAAEGRGNDSDAAGRKASEEAAERRLRPHLENALKAAKALAYEAAADRRKRGGKGFFSAYALASQVGIRTQDGPRLMALLEAQPEFAEAMAEEIEKARAAQQSTDRNETELERTA
ncbi:DUF2637 domain-containing protein [Streptomyces goshikiensis]|uniref:DUF2637 domain-containing protein n=1 Tax=Streptomyces goshikiensis TaxID=1942 RepID=UPI0037BCF9FF